MLFGQKNIARYISAQQQNYILRNDANMYIRLIRNEAKGNAITGRLVIDGRWFCNTLERVGYEIPALCYHVVVTMSPKFKRMLPLVCGVPQTVGDKAKGDKAPHDTSAVGDPAQAMRQGIRIHRGSKPEHSTGCVLVVADVKNDNIDNLRPNQYSLGAHGEQHSSSSLAGALIASGTLSPLSSTNTHPVGSRTAADVEKELTNKLLKAQQEHEEIILEVTDFRAGTELGYNSPCPRELQQHKIDTRHAEQRYLALHAKECES